MTRKLLALLFLYAYNMLTLSAQQIEPVFVHPELKKPNHVVFSLNRKFALVAKENYSYREIVYAVFKTQPYSLLASGKITLQEEKDPTIIDLSNDGMRLLIGRLKDGEPYGSFYISDKQMHNNNGYENEFRSAEDFYMHSSGHYSDGKYYVDLHYYDKSFEIIDTVTKISRKYNNERYHLDLSGEDKVQISSDGLYMAVFHKSIIYVWDIINEKLLWQSPKQPDFFFASDFALLDNHTILCNKVLEDHKNLHLYWYDFMNHDIIFSSDVQPFAEIVNATQMGPYLTIMAGGAEKYRIENIVYADLSTGSYEAKNKSEVPLKKNRYVNPAVDKFEQHQPEAYQYVLKNHQSDYSWYHFYSRFYNEDGSLKNPDLLCEVDTSYFRNINLSANNFITFYALNNKATFIDRSNDLPFFGINFQKKELLFFNGNISPYENRFVRLYCYKNGALFFITPDFYYMGKQNLNNTLFFRKGNEIFTFDQFDLKFNRPDIVLQRIGYADSTLIEAYHRAYLKRIKKAGFTEEMLKEDIHLPQLEIPLEYETEGSVNDHQIPVKLLARDDLFLLNRIQVLNNDVPVFGRNGISIRELNTHVVEKEIMIPLAEGKNILKITVMNDAGAESLTKTLTVNSKQDNIKRNLYLISIGSGTFQSAEYNLKYAGKDARDIAELFSQNKEYSQVFSRIICDSAVSKKILPELRSFLSSATINDEVILFYAGHGLLDTQLDYYFSTYDIDFNDPKENGIAYDDFENLLDGIKPLKKIMMIDACHSGEIEKEEMEIAANTAFSNNDVHFRSVGNTTQPKLGIDNTSELTKTLFSDLRKGTGATIISSAGGAEFAMESTKWNNGLFTYCLLNGISNKEADLNHDGKIMLNELQEYVFNTVYQLSNGRQQPNVRMENKALDYRLW